MMKNNAARTNRRKGRRKNSILTILVTLTIMLTMAFAGTLTGFAGDEGGSDPLIPFLGSEGNMYPFLPGHAPNENSPDDGQDGQTAGQEADNGQDGNTSETGKKAETPKAPAAKLTAVKISKPKAGKKGFTARWKKIKKSERKSVKRVEIQFSRDRRFESGVKTVYAGTKNASKRIKGVKKGRYYVRVRACAKSGGNAEASEWSVVRSVRVR